MRAKAKGRAGHDLYRVGPDKTISKAAYPTMLGSAMEQLGKRVLVKRTADSDLARAHAGQTGEIMMFTKSPETMVLMSYTIRLDNGEQIELAPSEVEILS